MLRALAAALVLLRHLDLVLIRADIYPDILQFDNVEIDIFFGISGFVMVQTVGRRPVSAALRHSTGY